MKPPPSVEEIARLLVDLRNHERPDEYDRQLARAILARVRESVPHVVEAADRPCTEPQYVTWCKEEGGACAWEEPR